MTPTQADAFVTTLSDQEVLALAYDWSGTWARPKQLPPVGEWTTWLILAGRGFGKSRTGAEWVRQQVESGAAKRIALVGRSAADVRDVMIEGESGILAVSPPWCRPVYEPSKRRLSWPNGAIATAYSADEPNQLRGPQHDAAWADELAAWSQPDAWDQLQFGLRLGRHPQQVVTTTPRPTKIIRALASDPATRITRGSTFENQRNLALSFLKVVKDKYEGTRLGRQELHAEILDDTPGALWTRAMIDACQATAAPDDLARIVIAVDPSANAGGEDGTAECGIVAGGVTRGDPGAVFVLGDRSGSMSPLEWGRAAVQAYKDFKADRIVAEANQGGEMVRTIIHQIDPSVPVTLVHASRGKHARAEPVAALYEQSRVWHVGSFPQMEDQMATYVPATAAKSPDRMDALVWLVTDLVLDAPGLPHIELL